MTALQPRLPRGVASVSVRDWRVSRSLRSPDFERLDNMEPLKIAIPVGEESVSGLMLRPAEAKALYLFAHGAGAGMTHKSMTANAEGLAARGIATLRYQFLYIERGRKRPDPPALAHAVVRAAATQAALHAPDLPLFAGGRSFGGRLTSQTQAGDL